MSETEKTNNPPGRPQKPEAVLVETYVVMGPDEGDFTPCIMVRAERGTAYESVEKLADEEIASMEEEFGITLLHRDNLFLKNNAPAEAALILWEAEGEDLYFRKLYTLFEDTAYTLTLTFRDSSGLGTYPEGQRVLDTFDPPGELVWS